MSSEIQKDDEEISMPEFWKEFGERLSRHVPTEKINEFAVKKNLSGFRLDRVVQGKKGVDVKTLINICKVLDLSPTWLLFGKGKEALSGVGSRTNSAVSDLMTKKINQIAKSLPRVVRESCEKQFEELNTYVEQLDQPESSVKKTQPRTTGSTKKSA